MRKAILLLSLTLVGIAMAYGSPITSAQARQKALDFLSARGRSTDLTMVGQGRRSAASTGAPAAANYYVFNQGTDKGFVIVGGDDATYDVLGYADQGHFDPTNVPSNLQALLDNYDDEIAWLRSQPTVATPRAKAPSANGSPALQVVAPLLTSLWNQSEPFNLKCLTTSGERAKTGCVATAFAQVMYYYKWPRSATQQIPAYSSYEALPPITFDWASMLDSYSSSTDATDATNASNKAVAELMVYCGHAVNMSYGTGSSGASSSRISSSLTNYFGYGNTAVEIGRDSYSTSEWDDIIYRELVAGRPVIYSANSATGGHSFVCDGFDGYGLFHINWGWGGLSNGYFRLQACNPSSQGTGGSSGYTGYSNSQSAIIGISPVELGQSTATADGSGITCVDFYLTDNSWSEISEGSYNYNSSYGLSSVLVYYYFSHTGMASSYDVGIGLYDEGGTLLDTYVVRSGFQGSASSWSGSGFSLWGFGTGLSDGTYYIRGIDRAGGTETWYASTNSDVYSLKVVISGNQCKVSTLQEQKEALVSITGVEQNFERGSSPKCIRAMVRNDGTSSFNAPLYLYVDGSLLSYESVYLTPGSEDYVDFYFSGSAGTHKIEISTLAGPDNIRYTNAAFELADKTTLPKLTYVSSKLNNIDGSTMYGQLIDGSITLTNATDTDYDSPLTLRLLKPAEDNYWYMFNQSLQAHIPAGQTVTLAFSLPISVGEKFQLSIRDANTSFASFGTLTVKAGLVSWTATGERKAVAPTSNLTIGADVAAVSFEELGALSGYTIKANTNPNTLYYLPHGATVPSALKGKNVVKAYEAGTITLSEGNGFYVPKAFTASKITYTRKAALACNGASGWQTITLPFAVEQVTSNGSTLQHITDNAPTSSGYCLKYFAGNEGSKVTFANAEAWTPNTPYLLGTSASSKGQSLVFGATDAQVQPTTVRRVVNRDFEMVGTTGDLAVSGAYVMNESGNAFVLTDNATVPSANAYFLCHLAENVPSTIPLGSLIGDVNGDGLVSIADVMVTVDYIMGRPVSTFITENADINGDDNISVTDVSALVSLILNN